MQLHLQIISTLQKKNGFRHLTLKKSHKRFLQITHLMLDLLYHKHNLLITTAVDCSIFRTLEEILVLPWYYNDEIIIKNKMHFHAYEKLLNILQNFAIYLLFYFAYYDNFSKWYIFILQDKLNALLLHNFTKCFSMHHSKSNSKCLKG